MSQVIPSLAAGVEDVFVGLEGSVGEVLEVELTPKLFVRVEFWAVGRQEEDGEVIWKAKLLTHVPPGTIHDDDGVFVFLDFGADFFEMQVESLGVCIRQDESSGFVLCRADSSKNVGTDVLLLSRDAGSCSPDCPDSG